MKLLIIFNPHAAHGRSVKRRKVIESRFKALGIETSFMATSFAGHGTKLVADATLTNFDGLVAAGGDGTVFEVLNGLYQHPKTNRIPLGILPVGTGNAFARELHFKEDALADAIERLQRGKTRTVDVGHVKSADRSFYFLNIVSMGFAVDAGLVALKMKFLGQSAYTLATLWQVLKLRSYPLRMKIDGKSIRSNNIFVTFSNSQYTGTHFLIAPGAEIDDGQLDVTILEKLPRYRLLRLFPSIYSGRHVDYEEVVTYKASHISLLSPEGFLLGPDGEFCGRTPAEITCLPGDLEIFS